MFTSHEVNQTPSSKTSILLRDIGMDSTLESLKGAISAAEVDYRKIEVHIVFEYVVHECIRKVTSPS